MRYTLMFRGAEQAERPWEATGDNECDHMSTKVERWFSAHAGRITRSCRLRSYETATTLRPGQGPRLRVLDEPFCADRDAFTGYVEVEVAGLEEALDMVRGWPARATVEIRPIA
ncbi:YciI family protein [Streptosporangium sp. H16]|uniref:YciI family protein n=1 Tax=Streptosporangium sp. H16 TaxID=3444184 RepID=UPI003F78C1F7